MKSIKNICKVLFISVLVFFGGAIYSDTINTTAFIQALKDKKAAGQKLSPHEALYIKYAVYNNHYLSWYTFDWDELVSKISHVEKDMLKKGYTTFVHGRAWEWNFLNDVWNLICAVKNKQTTMSDRISLRQRADNYDVKQLLQYRKDLIAYGGNMTWGSGTESDGRSAEITCMNRTVMSLNMYTAGYVHGNSSAAGYHKALELALALLKDYGLQKYENEVSKLFEMHQECSQYGELLCISVHKKYLNEMVYTASSGGAKYDYSYMNQLMSFVVAGNNNVAQAVTDGVANVFKDKTYYDCTDHFYCLAVSDIPGEYGVKYTINSVNLADQVKLKSYKNKLDNLFAKIKKDLKIK